MYLNIDSKLTKISHAIINDATLIICEVNLFIKNDNSFIEQTHNYNYSKDILKKEVEVYSKITNHITSVMCVPIVIYPV